MSDRVVRDLLLPDRGNSVALDINWLSFSPSVAALMPGLLPVLIWEQRSLQKAVTWFGSFTRGEEDPENQLCSRWMVACQSQKRENKHREVFLLLMPSDHHGGSSLQSRNIISSLLFMRFSFNSS